MLLDATESALDPTQAHLDEVEPALHALHPSNEVVEPLVRALGTSGAPARGGLPVFAPRPSPPEWFHAGVKWLATAALLLPGCLADNTVSGTWSVSAPGEGGCSPDDDVHVEVPSGHGPIVSDRYPCTATAFAIDVPANHHDFSVKLLVWGSAYDWFVADAIVELTEVTSDIDIGHVTFTDL
jgi:hypothetical protein